MPSTASLAASAYVPNEKDDSISVIDLASQTVTETLKVGMRPRGLLLSSDNKLLYICASDSDRVQVMDLATRKIIKELPTERQTIMFSATLPPKIREMARTILRNPAEVNIAISKPNEAIDQSAYVCYENQKLGIIREMFDRRLRDPAQILQRKCHPL